MVKKNCLIFYLEMTGKAVFIEKIEEKNTISFYILVANFFTPKYAFFVVKLPYVILNSFNTAIMLFLKYCLAKSGIYLSKS